MRLADGLPDLVGDGLLGSLKTLRDARVFQAPRWLRQSFLGVDLLAPLGMAGLLRLWEHFGALDAVVAARWSSRVYPGAAPVLEAYRRARAIMGEMSYEQRAALVAEWSQRDLSVFPSLLGIVDWRPEEVRRWTKHWQLQPLGALARDADPRAWDLLAKTARRYRSEPYPRHYDDAWREGRAAWFFLLAYGRIPLPQLTADLKRRLTRSPRDPVIFEFRPATECLPPSPRSLLSAALSAVVAEAEAPWWRLYRWLRPGGARDPLVLLNDFGPAVTDSLIPAALGRMGPGDVEAWDGIPAGAVERLLVGDAPSVIAELRSIAPGRRLCAAALANEELLDALCASFGGTTEADLVLAYTREDFPPGGQIPTPRAPDILRGLYELAEGRPGEPVPHGLIPSRLTKLARLSLAAGAHHPAAEVVEAAISAYSTGPYCAHDAVACALIHPGVDQEQRLALAKTLWSWALERCGWRSRKKLLALLRWAARRNRLPGDFLPH